MSKNKEGAAMSSAVIIKELLCKLQTLVGLINDLRSNLIRLLREHRNYGLVWEDKSEDVLCSAH